MQAVPPGSDSWMGPVVASAITMFGMALTQWLASLAAAKREDAQTKSREKVAERDREAALRRERANVLEKRIAERRTAFADLVGHLMRAVDNSNAHLATTFQQSVALVGTMVPEDTNRNIRDFLSHAVGEERETRLVRIQGELHREVGHLERELDSLFGAARGVTAAGDGQRVAER